MVFLGPGVEAWPRLLQPLARVIYRIEEWWFWYRANAAYARLRRDPVAWAEELEERRLSENTLMDGLEDDPWPQEDVERWMKEAEAPRT